MRYRQNTKGDILYGPPVIDMILRPIIGSTTLLTMIISMKGIPIIPLLSSQSPHLD